MARSSTDNVVSASACLVGSKGTPWSLMMKVSCSPSLPILHNVDYSFLKGQIETHCQWHVKTNLLSNGIDKFVQLWNSFDVVRQRNLSFYRRICLYVSHLLLI